MKKSKLQIAYPPGPKSLLPFGARHLAKFAFKPIAFLEEVSKFGELEHHTIYNTQVYTLNKPDYIKDVLVTNQKKFHKGNYLNWLKHLTGEGVFSSEGNFHLRQRRLAQPAFHRKRIANYADTMINYAYRTQASWQDGDIINIPDEMTQLTLKIAAKTLFNADIEADKELKADLQAIGEWSQRATLLYLAEVLELLPLPSNKRFRAAYQHLSSFIYQLINERRKNGDAGDLLSMLVEASDEEGDKQKMEDKQIRDEVVTFLLAGHDTTAVALTWAWYLLAQHPEKAALLYQEVDEVLAGRLPTMEDLSKLHYTEAIFAETLRLYPSAYLYFRMNLEEYQLAGYSIPANSLFLISPYIMHHNGKYFDEPEAFKPERWTPEFKASLPKYAYIPFGAGPRTCIGEPFAWTEGVLVLATIAQNWHLQLLPNQNVKMQPRVTLRSSRFFMRLQRRKLNTSNILEERKQSLKL